MLGVSDASQKLFGVLSGHGIAGTAPLFEKWGLRPGKPLVVLAGCVEFVSGMLLILGLGTPLAAAGAIGTMAVAAYVTGGNGFWAVSGGCELPLAYGVIGAVLAFTGPGHWSVDGLAGWTYAGGGINGVVALVLGLLPAAAFAAYTRSQLADGPEDLS